VRVVCRTRAASLPGGGARRLGPRLAQYARWLEPHFLPAFPSSAHHAPAPSEAWAGAGRGQPRLRLDPLLLIAASNRPLRFIIAREQYERFGLHWLLRAVGCIPLDRAASSHRALAAARHALQHGEVVALFPHGRIHLDTEEPARLKPGILHLAKLSGAPVYPLRIEGVSGAGRTVSAVFRRSRARLTVFPHIYYQENATESLLEVLGRRLGRHPH
jgi:hypothetical protein